MESEEDSFDIIDEIDSEEITVNPPICPSSISSVKIIQPRHKISTDTDDSLYESIRKDVEKRGIVLPNWERAKDISVDTRNDKN